MTSAPFINRPAPPCARPTTRRGPLPAARILILAAAMGCATRSAGPQDPARYEALVGSSDRTDDDRVLDTGRRPAALLAFIGLPAGAAVADLAAGDGYTTELLARAVGPTGVVYAQNPPFLLKSFPAVADGFDRRLARPAMARVVKAAREMEDPLPPEARDLDAVVMNLFYHDTFWLGTDRQKMNQAIAKALKPGGVFVIIDHSAKEGAGAKEVKTLHRIEEKVVTEDLRAAGFELAGRSDFLRNPSDSRTWNVFDEGRRGTTDRFALKFVKR